MKITRITKRLSALALCAVLAVGSLAVSAGAAQSTTVTAQISPNIDVVVDGVERTFTPSMKLSMMVKPMPLRSAPPVVNMGWRARSTSGMPTPLSFTWISRVLSG